jgi:hypothetical protein
LAVAVVLLSGCGGRSNSHLVSVDGRIGPLHVDRSDRADVVRFAGRPDAERTGRNNSVSYRALGYDCGAPSGTFRFGLSGAYCRTVFFLAGKGDKLRVFFTSSPEYAETDGVRIGMKQAAAERLLHQRLIVGCTTALHFTSPTGALSISFGGGRDAGTKVTGAHVDAFVLHGTGIDPDIFDCL